VSSNKQKDDLERQVTNMQSYLLAQGKPYEIIQDRWWDKLSKKGLQTLIKHS